MSANALNRVGREDAPGADAAGRDGAAGRHDVAAAAIGIVPGTARAIEITSDPARIDIGRVHRFLSEESHWARGIDRTTVERALRHSVCFAALEGGRQIGFARVVTDRATFAYVADVFVETAERGRGVARLLVREILAHPDVRRLRRVLLVSRDARGLYERAGFTPLAHPDRWLERHDVNAYGAAA